MTSHIEYEGQLRTRAIHLQSGTAITTDAPTDNNGKGECFSPTDLVATALGSCMLTIMAIRARDMEGVVLERTSIDVLKVMQSAPRRIAAIELTFHFPAELQISDVQKTILEKAAHSCPVAQSLHASLEVTVYFRWP